MAQGNSDHGKLYTRFVSNLKVIQYFGYFIVVASNLNFFFSAGAGFLLMKVLLQAVLSSLTVYIITQALIVIVDLLSRIELNTHHSSILLSPLHRLSSYPH